MTILYGTVKYVSERGLEIAFGDGAVGHVPFDEVFVTKKKPVQLRELVYDYPIIIAVGQCIPVVPLAEPKGGYSRRQAALQTLKTVQKGDILPVTITEISLTTIFCVADAGFDVRVPYQATRTILQWLFAAPRLNPETLLAATVDSSPPCQEREEDWLYIRDHIMVQIVGDVSDTVKSASLLVRGAPILTQTRKTPMAPSELPIAPSSDYEDVLFVLSDIDMAESLDHYFRDGGYRTHFAVGLADVRKWRDSYFEELQRTGAEPAKFLAIVELSLGNPVWEEVAQFLVEALPFVDMIVASSNKTPLNPRHQASVQSRVSSLHIIGLWLEDSGTQAIGALLQRQSALSLDPAMQSAADGGSQITGSALVPAATFGFPRYHGIAEDCRGALETWMEAAGDNAAPCAAILFGIHRKGHSVCIVSGCGDDRILKNVERFLSDLHKSPIRDLALFRQPVDTDDASRQEGKYRYFLHPMGGLDSHLSVLGIRPTAPVNDPYAYAAFLFSGRLRAFRNNPRLSPVFSHNIRRTLELALNFHALDRRAGRLLTAAEQVFDFQSMAHEATGCLKIPQELLSKCKQEELMTAEDIQTTYSGLARAYAVMKQFLPGSTIEYTEFSPNESVRELFALCQELEESPTIVLTLESDLQDGEYVSGRRLAFECVLRNIVLNAIQQIEEYCCETGRVTVRITTHTTNGQTTTLMVTVADDGPGIHGKHWDAIFKPGVSTRQKGTGLGLAVSLRLITEAKGTLALTESCVYSGSTFTISIPVKIEERTMTVFRTPGSV